MFVLLVGLVACVDAVAPYTLGPGCWAKLPLHDSTGKTIAYLQGHWADCPDPMPDGYVFSHWDTTFVKH